MEISKCRICGICRKLRLCSFCRTTLLTIFIILSASMISYNLEAASVRFRKILKFESFPSVNADLYRTTNVSTPEKHEMPASLTSQDDRILNQISINQKRLDHVRQICQKYSNDTRIRDLSMAGSAMVTENPNVVYCWIPKNGCTSLKRFIRFISGDYKQNASITNMEDIPRVYTHFSPLKKVKLLALRDKRHVKKLNEAGYKFMMAREPYSRLWSAYLDKFYLPDFWHTHGKRVINKVRIGADERSRRCGHNATFVEFLIYLAVNLARGNQVDPHFHQSYQRCNPCEMNFNLLGKIESFTDDFNLILNATNLTSTIKTGSESAKRDHAMEEIKMLTIYNFEVAHVWRKKRDNDTCMVPAEVAERLWRVFQFNGYIGDDSKFPAAEVNRIHTREGIRDYLIEKFTEIRNKASNEDQSAWKRQRKFFLKQAYQTIPLVIKERIRDSFTLDFEIFDYDAEPSFVFPANYTSNYNNNIIIHSKQEFKSRWKAKQDMYNKMCGGKCLYMQNF